MLVALAHAPLVAVAGQTAALEARPGAALDPAALSRMLHAHPGRGRVARSARGLLLLLGTFLAVRAEIRDRADWRAARGQIALLGVVRWPRRRGQPRRRRGARDTPPPSTADVAAPARRRRVDRGPARAGLLLGLASRAAGADARPYAVRAARRFSRGALALVSVLVISGIWTTVAQVGSVAGLLGTRHGRLLVRSCSSSPRCWCWRRVNRRLMPSLAGEAATVGRPAMRRLSGFVACETALALVSWPSSP